MIVWDAELRFHGRESEDGGEGMVLLLPEGQEVSDRDENEQSYRIRVLEGDGEGQGDLQGQKGKLPDWDEEDPGVLQRESSQRREIQLGHA